MRQNETQTCGVLNDFRRNLLVNLGLFRAGVWVARNLTHFDLMSLQPVT
ncbi:mitochondrial import receptor subunit TOM6 homolog [Perca fluviatilis]|nr:mitochondrial import receptor subunit TOM6 homolog [Perca fluviatilis]